MNIYWVPNMSGMVTNAQDKKNKHTFCPPGAKSLVWIIPPNHPFHFHLHPSMMIAYEASFHVKTLRAC